MLSFRITFSSNETGPLAPETFEIPVDGDPAECRCNEWVSVKLHRGSVANLSPGWSLAAFPLTSANDDETPLFPMDADVPGTAADTPDPLIPLTLYRLLLPGDIPASPASLKATTEAGAIHFSFQ
jgi:hypothetical protein